MPRPRGRLVLLGLFALFFLPILVAYGLNVFRADWSPFGRVNHGELISPARKLSTSGVTPADGRPFGPTALEGRWTIVSVVAESCTEACKARIHLHSQTRLALGKDMDRVQLLLIARAGLEPDTIRELLGRYPDLRIVTASAAWVAMLDGEPGGGASAYVVDPQGYAILRYSPDLPDRSLLDDVKRLLKASKLG